MNTKTKFIYRGFEIGEQGDGWHVGVVGLRGSAGDRDLHTAATEDDARKWVDGEKAKGRHAVKYQTGSFPDVEVREGVDNVDELMRFDQYFPVGSNPLAPHVLVHVSARGGKSVGVFGNRVGALETALTKAGALAKPFKHDDGMFLELGIGSTFYVVQVAIGNPDLVRVW